MKYFKKSFRFLIYVSISVFVTAVLLMLSAMPADAADVYFCDAAGRVGHYDTVSTALNPVGNLSASFSIAQVIGMAWDPATGRLLLLDRNASNVYSMDPVTGTASLLFTATGVTFQGGAVKNGALYGINESTQTAAAYNLTTFTSLGLAGGVLSGHTHSTGIDPASGQLYASNNTDIYRVADSGAYVGTAVTTNTWFEDIDYFNGDFLGVRYDQQVYLINGGTGSVSTFLNSAQVTSTGVVGSLSGIVVGGGVTAVPPPTCTHTMNMPTSPTNIGTFAPGIFMSYDPMVARPFGLEESGDILTGRLWLPCLRNGHADIYLVLDAPAYGGKFMLSELHQWLSFPANIQPWMTYTDDDVYAALFSLQKSGILPGNYKLDVIVVPSGTAASTIEQIVSGAAAAPYYKWSFTQTLP
ncbi:MAG: hypothetical protein AB1306_05900 [Nitrospirota bacterium]